MDNTPVRLVPFAGKLQTRDLKSTLAALGRPPVVIHPDRWLTDDASGNDTNPLLLFFGELRYPLERIRSVLEERRPRAIAVFAKDNASLDPAIATWCHDFVCWPCDSQELLLRLQRFRGAPPTQPSCDEVALLAEFADLNLLGHSPAFVATLKLIKRIAGCDATVLINGETGTGKEMAARAIHYLSARRDYPFIPLNCAAIPDNLIENEFFGHERGAFTDAKTTQAGVIEQAQRGTIFLDEIDSLSPKGQATLLRFLQDQQYRPLGAKGPRQANVRITVASNQCLGDLVRAGNFRQDLFFRLNILELTMPPLRERPGDAEVLARHFIDEITRQSRQTPKRLNPTCLAWLGRQNWPGNVRELQNLIHREFFLAEGDELQLHHRQVTPVDRRASLIDRRLQHLLHARLGDSKDRLIADFEKQYLATLLAETGGNVTQAARRAGKERRSLGKLLKKHGLEKSRFSKT